MTPHTVSSVPRRPARLLEAERCALVSHVTSCRLLFVVPLFVLFSEGGRDDRRGPVPCGIDPIKCSSAHYILPFDGADAVLPCLERRRRPTHLCLELAVHSFKQRARNTRMAGDSARGVEWSCAPDQDAKRSSHKGRGPQWLVGPPISPMKVTFDSMSYV